jgi:hypothetical protein
MNNNDDGDNNASGGCFFFLLLFFKDGVDFYLSFWQLSAMVNN